MTEKVYIQIPITTIPCIGQSNLAGGDQVHYLENYIDQMLPAEVRIVESIFWWDGYAAITSSTIGNIAYAIDPGSRYITASGFPVKQDTWPESLSTLGIYEIFAGGSRQKYNQHTPPIVYRSGDALIVAPETNGGGQVAGAFIALGIESDQGPIFDWPSAAHLMNSLPNLATGAGAAYDIRNVIAGPPVDATQIRVHIACPSNVTPPCIVSKLSVGLRDGVTSSTVSPPVELKFERNSGYSLQLRQGMWSDWTDLAMPANADILVAMEIPGTGGRPYQDGAPGTKGAYYSSTTGTWNQTAMAGAVTNQQTRTHVIDKVQYR